jgi:Sulfotransferase domain
LARVVANSIPKSGTHLLDRLLVLLGFRMVEGGIRPHLVAGRYGSVRRLLRGRGEKVTVGVVSPQLISRRWLARRLAKVPHGAFVNAHCIYSPELATLFAQQGMRTVCILRDPRDVAVSQMHFIKERKQHFAHEGYMALPSDHERLMLSIRGGELGGRELQPLDQRYRQFLRWGQEGGAVMVKFEDLVGPEGGGSAEARRLVVERVAGHLGVPVGEGTMRAVEEGLFGVGRTFRKGQVGGWREEFSPEHERAVEEVAGPLLMELGYEANPDR